VAGIEHLGALSSLRLNAPELTIQVSGQTALIAGDQAKVSLPPEHIHVFDSAGTALTSTSKA
jgi:hypothetical protein